MGVAPRRALLVLLAGWLAVSGCGYRNPTPRDKARAAAETFVDSCARQEPARAVEVMTDSLRASFIRAGSAAEACARLMGLDPAGLSGPALADAVRTVSVESVAVSGAVARATLRAPGGARQQLGLGFTGGEWKVDTGPPGT
jgi:hypothetical protein